MARDFEFSSPSYALFTKICLDSRGALDMSRFPRVESKLVFWVEGCWTCQVGHLNMSSVPRVELFFVVLGRGEVDMSSGASRHVEGDLG